MTMFLTSLVIKMGKIIVQVTNGLDWTKRSNDLNLAKLNLSMVNELWIYKLVLSVVVRVFLGLEVSKLPFYLQN